MYVCDEIGSRCLGNWLLACSTVQVQICQNGVRDLHLDLDDEVKVRRSRNFNWPYLGHFWTQNQSVYCSELLNGFNAHEHINWLWPFDFEIWQNVPQNQNGHILSWLINKTLRCSLNYSLQFLVERVRRWPSLKVKSWPKLGTCGKFHINPHWWLTQACIHPTCAYKWFCFTDFSFLKGV